ncbi:peptidyl-prolyl cis-trans isomerase-like 4 isoform X2 [Antedon mediterranea]|uniref:peptidyl-prolyl cis-trans isomerase-like 4 isoform X2 n=1 Tax=Antedon mediterranea TaxID=105859 RepID=UPI003AF52481
MAVLLETTLGDIVIDLYPKERPRCCLNFLKLCKLKYYNFCLFHSVQRNFIAQTGDPSGSGNGGESVFRQLYGDQARYFEMESTPRIKHKKLGAVSMVNNGANMHGSQFFITLSENVDSLDGMHTVFGEVSEGFDIITKLSESFTDKENRPYQDIRINHTVVLDDPFDDPDGLTFPDRSPEPTKEQLDSGRIAADEEVDKDKGKTEEELKEELESKESKANAHILEMVGDIPDADIKPPENVLFVCKLNPVTTSDDLQIIFSRFGQINSCEVIKDMKTEESLQYAFIEFERVEDCEQAYFKMDNVLIDDRRIHVDFSQSVAKLNQKQKFVGSFPSSSKDKPKPRHEEDRQPKISLRKHELSESDSSSSSDDDKRLKRRHKKDRKDKHKKKTKNENRDSKKERRRSRIRSMDYERGPRHRSREKDHVKSRRDRSRDRETKRDRSRSRDRNSKRDRSRSHDRKTKRDRSRSRDRKTKRDRSRSRDRHIRYRDRR